jgi:hypothetical protein
VHRDPVSLKTFAFFLPSPIYQGMTDDRAPPKPTSTTQPLARSQPGGAVSPAGDVARFLDEVRKIPVSPGGPRGRLMFALDATMSRQPTWDRAQAVQAEMFDEAGRLGGLEISLVYFRGFNECRASKWVNNAATLRDLMTRIDCRGGRTQIQRVLSRAVDETRRQRVQALVYVGDAMEEDIDLLCATAGELGVLGVKAFLFQEGHDPTAERAFKEIARLTGGAHVRFQSGSAKELSELLRAVAAYAAGGTPALKALSDRGSAGAKLLMGPK